MNDNKLIYNSTRITALPEISNILSFINLTLSMFSSKSHITSDGIVMWIHIRFKHGDNWIDGRESMVLSMNVLKRPVPSKLSIYGFTNPLMKLHH